MHTCHRQIKKFLGTEAGLLDGFAFGRNVLLARVMFVCVSFVCAHAKAETQRTVSVQIESAKLRASPQPWARAVADLNYGDKVNVSSIERGWVKGAIASSVEGYVHESAVTSKKILLKSVAASLDDLTVDDSDVYLAGKGFNRSTEELLAKRDTALNFGAVDKMVAIARSAEVGVGSFVEKGKLVE